MIVAGSDALVSNENATPGANVYPGDILVTHSSGSLRVALGSGQLYLLASTKTALIQNSGAVRAKVDSGIVDFSIPQTGSFEVQTPLGVIREDGGVRAFGQVAVLSPNEIRISAYEGRLTMTTADGEARSVAAGETYDASNGPSGGSSDPGVLSVRRSKKVNWKRVAAEAVIIGGTSAVAYVIYRKVTESCSQINCGK